MSAVLANTELYEVPLPDSDQIAFTPAKDGLPIFHGKSYDEHLEAWIHVSESVECRRWALGAIAASLERHYRDAGMKQFVKDLKARGHEVGLSTLYRYSKTYEVFKNSQRRENRSFQHHAIAAPSPDPVDVITRADLGGWTTRQTERYVETGLEPGETSGIDASAIAQVAVADIETQAEAEGPVETPEDRLMMDHLMEAQQVISDLKAKCPRQKFVVDVYDGWLEELSDHLEQFALESLKDKVVSAWRSGKYQENEIASLTNIPKDQIHSVMKAYEREGVFQKIQRRKTAMAKGTRPWIWHLSGEPIGSDYERVPRHRYEPFVEYGDEGEEHF